MSKMYAGIILLCMVLLAAGCDNKTTAGAKEEDKVKLVSYKQIKNTVQRGETFSDIFKKYQLDIEQLFELTKASRDVHKLKDIQPGQQYVISVDDDEHVNGLKYWIDDESCLTISRGEGGFCAEKINIPYEKRLFHIGGTIRDNLISSIGGGRENLMLALDLSDILAWDIDFNTDLRDGDTYRVIVEGLFNENGFRKYGDILAVEFVNDGRRYSAYRFEYDGKADYYDGEGKSLKKAFLRAPLSYRRISSGFSRSRRHPVLKIYRPHRGVDYVAQRGTPVSAAGAGKVAFAGYRGQYGRLVIIRHPNRFVTYYGHLSKIQKGLHPGKAVDQGDVIGYVGSTGLATGPHLHYEMRVDNRHVNPLKIALPRSKPVPSAKIPEFKRVVAEMQQGIASIIPRLTVVDSPDSHSKAKREGGG